MRISTLLAPIVVMEGSFGLNTNICSLDQSEEPHNFPFLQNTTCLNPELTPIIPANFPSTLQILMDKTETVAVAIIKLVSIGALGALGLVCLCCSIPLVYISCCEKTKTFLEMLNESLEEIQALPPGDDKEIAIEILQNRIRREIEVPIDPDDQFEALMEIQAEMISRINMPKLARGRGVATLDHTTDDKICLICRDFFEVGQPIYTHRTNNKVEHPFHFLCMENWAATEWANSGTVHCPTCRAPI
jgi:hypothetical protein